MIGKVYCRGSGSRPASPVLSEPLFIETAKSLSLNCQIYTFRLYSYIVFIWTIYIVDLKKSLIIENLYNSNREV